MISALILAIIYLSFISLGLPDSVLGSAWPVMSRSLGADPSLGGTISMVVSAGTVISSIVYSRIEKRAKAGIINLASVAFTALALLGFSFSRNIFMTYAFAIVLGLGAGAIDASLNNYVALHYKARHMSWLHAAWGIGTTVAPVLLSWYFAAGYSWRDGYRTISAIQSCIFLILLISLPIWKKAEKPEIGTQEDADEGKKASPIFETLSMKGAKVTLFSFFLYCGIEATCILWLSSYGVYARAMDASAGARLVSFFFYGITAGRIVTGLFNDKTGDNVMIFLGHAIFLFAAAILLFGQSLATLCTAAFLLGFGCGPVYPSMLHQTPRIFSSEKSGELMGLEMATAYIGSTSCPLIYGLVAGKFGYDLLAYVAILFCILEIIAFASKLKFTRSTTI